MSRFVEIDERSEQVSGKLAFLFLGLTQAGLLIAIVIQRYGLGLAPAYYNDLAVVMGYSIFGFWGTSLLLGGLLPKLKNSTFLAAYLFLVFAIAVPHLIIRGLPHAGEWLRWSLIVFGAPGLLVGGYGLAAVLGKKRLDRMVGS